jgi:hypothetical protein
MWIFTETGFVSAVEDRHNPQNVSVRARDKVSLVAVSAATGEPILRSPDGDYPYRVFISKDAFAAWLADEASQIDYRNFKGRVFDTRGHEFAHELGRVWSVMLAVEDEDARTGKTGQKVEVVT